MPEVSFPVALVDGAPVVIAPEEIDVTNAAALRATLEAAGRGNETLVVDMSQTQFCDSSGVNVLARAQRRAQTEGGRILLVVSSAAVLRILALTGADRMIPNFPTLDEALGRAPVPQMDPPAASA